ncbi:hypothetical protein HYR99_03705 [Candidatus Poribacteria bacterium]|nr:hypothetical protein [Candidatus Poribacteria bacterium]
MANGAFETAGPFRDPATGEEFYIQKECESPKTKVVTAPDSYQETRKDSPPPPCYIEKRWRQYEVKYRKCQINKAWAVKKGGLWRAVGWIVVGIGAAILGAALIVVTGGTLVIAGIAVSAGAAAGIGISTVGVGIGIVAFAPDRYAKGEVYREFEDEEELSRTRIEDKVDHTEIPCR